MREVEAAVGQVRAGMRGERLASAYSRASSDQASQTRRNLNWLSLIPSLDSPLVLPSRPPPATPSPGSARTICKLWKMPLSRRESIYGLKLGVFRRKRERTPSRRVTTASRAGHFSPKAH